LLTDDADSQAPPIRCQLTARGLLLQSEDIEALDRFEELVRTIAGPFDSMPSPPIVFYLKYAKPEDAIRVLAELLDGGEAAKEGQAGSLVNAYVSSGSSGFLGSMVTSRDGLTTLMDGSITVVADSRLNRLIAQGTASDIELIENYLKIIDKDSSITSVEVHGTSRVIELLHTKASDVAATIREAYAGRIASSPGSGAARQVGSPQQAQREAVAARMAGEKQPEAERKAAAGKPAGGRAQTLEPKMTIAVHEPSNSLIVTAPPQLLEEVEQLVKLIDGRSEEAFETIAPANSAAIRTLLQQVLSNENRTSRRPAATTPRPTSAPPSSSRFPNRSGR
jgi:type II secretory pathway component GspD/PulD (secretin)